jgi:hypothetical protein
MPTMTTAITSSISVKPAAATRECADLIAARDGVAERKAGTAATRDDSGHSRLFHATQNRVDGFGRCDLTSVHPDKSFDPRKSKMHLCFHARCCCVINLADRSVPVMALQCRTGTTSCAPLAPACAFQSVGAEELNDLNDQCDNS